MIKKRYNVLIIDDHPLILEAYKTALLKVSLTSKKLKFKIETANTIDTAYQKIYESSKNNEIDIIFLDIKLPPSLDKSMLSGEDLGIKINQLLPDTKIIISTTFNDNFRIHSIFKSVNPDGFLIKNDISTHELILAIQTVINNPPYYSKTVLKLLRQQVSADFLLDKVDRQLLYELSIGTKMKDLPDILPLSIGAIEKRKRHLKELFEISSQDDRDLILVAKEKGFI